MRRAALAFALLAFAAASAAATYRVDDTGTTVSDPVVAMKWRTPAPGRGGDHGVVANLHVLLRLNLQPWMGRRARLYLAASTPTGEQVSAAWRTQGRLLPGSTVTGQRGLLYDGVIHDALQQEVLQLTLQADGRQLSQPQNLNFNVEIELLQ